MNNERYTKELEHFILVTDYYLVNKQGIRWVVRKQCHFNLADQDVREKISRHRWFDPRLCLWWKHRMPFSVIDVLLGKTKKLRMRTCCKVEGSQRLHCFQNEKYTQNLTMITYSRLKYCSTVLEFKLNNLMKKDINPHWHLICHHHMACAQKWHELFKILFFK